MSDKYDAAIKLLQEDPSEITKAWGYFRSHPAGCLFATVPGIGVCLTQIRKGMGRVDGPFESWKSDHALTQRIEGDERIPANEDEITVDMLPMFAEYQREFEPLRGVVADSTGAMGREE